MFTKKVLIANLKMALNHKQTELLIQQVSTRVSSLKKLHAILCPSYTALPGVKNILKNSSIEYGAQDCFWEDTGAYTGEISPADLSVMGCKYVIVGHSERRIHLSETNEMVHKKTRLTLENGMTPIICIGETWEERKDGRKDYVLISQLKEALEGISIQENQKIIIGYEPVWAISTGVGIEAKPEEVQYANNVIEHVLIDLFPKEFVENNVAIVYGGSVKANNVQSFLSLSNVSGVLVGGATHKEESFRALADAMVS